MAASKCPVSVAVICSSALFTLLAPSRAAATSKVDFNQDVRPLLSANCFHCHGPDEKKREAKLRLDVEEGMFERRDAGAIVAKGDADSSLLFQRMVTSDHGELMPPPETNKKLNAAEIATIRRWIEEGAEFSGHWAYIPPKRSPLPPIENTEWPRNDIDYFIAARNEAEGLSQSAEAGRESLIRRATFDITGLPPTLDEIDAFLTDKSPNAYEKVIDRLLNSQAYGEHMARFWLDVVRYGDTHGLHLDNYREMWPYRDWVVGAFNDNKPYDEFTIEQIAGDLLPNPTTTQLIASGYNRCNVTTSEGGSIEEEVYVRNVIDRVETTGTVFMGLTLGCAVCHDHKFDPFTMNDFYSMFAYFNSIDGGALDGNRKDHRPIIKAPTELQARDLKRWTAKLAHINKSLTAPNARIDASQRAWEKTLKPRPSEPKHNWQILDPESFTSKGGATLKKQKDKSLLATGRNPAKENYVVSAKLAKGSFGAIRLEALPDPSHTKKSLARSSNGNAVLTSFTAEIMPADKPDQCRLIRFTRAWADHEQPDGDFKIANALDGKDDTGWAIEGHNKADRREAVFVADKPFGLDEGSLLRLKIGFNSKFAQHHFGRVRLAVSKASSLPKTSPRIELGDWYSMGDFTTASYGRRSFNRAFGPEGKPFKADQKFSDNGEQRVWIHHPEWTDGVIHGDLPGNESATYVYRKIWSATSQKAVIHTGSSDALKVFVNNKAVLSKNEGREVAPDQDKIEISLKAGDNDLMLKVLNWQGDAGFFFRMDSPHVVAPDAIARIAAIAPAQRKPEQATRIRKYFRLHVANNTGLVTQRNNLFSAQKSLSDTRRAIPTTLIFRERKEPRDAFMLVRGNYDQKGAKTSRRTPLSLPPMAEGMPNDRLGFAKWLLAPKHPLTARVAVNRFWQQAFGVGLVRTSEDFGSQGSPPSHPELLDWLAVDFRESGWDIKRLMKQIVMSATYRQSSTLGAEHIERDPENRLLARGPRFRLDAEMLRDQSLAVSGLLVREIGGPSVKPPQPDGLWKAVGYSGSNTVEFYADKGDRVYRRSVYTFWKRTSPPPQMTAFDAPSRESCAPRRERTNTPLQALVLLNEPQYIEAARNLAERVWREAGATPEAKAAHMFRLATSRHANEGEVKELVTVLNDHLKEFKGNAESARSLIGIGTSAPDASIPQAELAAWTMVANLILNLDETITKG